MTQPDEFVERHVLLGHVAGAHGVRGALRLSLFNVETTTLAPGSTVFLRLRDPEAAPRSFQIRRLAPKPGSKQVRAWLVGIEDRSSAEALRGHELWVDRASLPEPETDEYYLHDLIGREVVRERGDELEPLGRITGVSSNGAQDLLVIELRGREWLLPALPPFVVAIEGERVVVDVHDDMLPSPSSGSGES